MKLTRMRAENLEKFIQDWRDAAAANMTRGEFCKLMGLSQGSVYVRQRNLERRGISLPLLRGQRGIGSNSGKARRVKVRLSENKRAVPETSRPEVADLRFVLYVGDCVA